MFLLRVIWMTSFCFCALYFFISWTITPSGLRVTFDFSWPNLVRSGSTRVTGLIFDCIFWYSLSSLLAVLIFDLIVLRRTDSFFHFSSFLKDWPVKRSSQYYFAVMGNRFETHMNWACFGWHVSALIFMSWRIFTRFLASMAYNPVLTLFR